MEYELNRAGLSMTVSDHGGELRALTVDGLELLWDGKEEVWPRRAPVCFPWCGQLEEGWFSWAGKRYEGPQHGFVRDLDHQLLEAGPEQVRFRLDWPGDGGRWPWAFRFETTHRLTETGTETLCAVENRSNEPMPVQMGFHPGFRCPFLPGTALEDYQVRFADGRVIPLEPHLFDNDSIRYEGVGDWARLEHRPSGSGLRVDTAGYPFVLLWSKPGIPGFVCIEPWQGYPGPGHDLARRPEAVTLAPGEKRTWRQKIDVELK